MLLAALLTANLAACRSGSKGEKLGERVIPLGHPVPKGGGTYKLGEPYQIGGVWYRPREDSGYDRVGTASWYGELFHGRRTANGEIYDMDRLSAASPTLPLPVYARVTNLENGRSLVVRVNDRGPYRRNRIIDLSRRSADLLGFRHKGTARVRVEYLGRAPLNGDDSYERRHLASQPWASTQFARGSGAGHTAEENVASLSPRRASPPRPNVAAEPRLVRPASLQVSGEVRPGALAGGSSDDAVRASGAFLIQAGSFRDEANAERARMLLGRIGNVDIVPVTGSGATFYRVRVGPFPDERIAAAALASVTAAGYAGAKIVRNQPLRPAPG